MGLKKQHRQHEEDEEEEEAAFFRNFVRYSFHTLSIATISLLFPLSFLTLARIQFFTTSSLPTPSSFPASVFLHAGLPFIFGLTSFISLLALLNSLTGRVLQPPAAVAWALLCLFQLSLAFGTEFTISAAGAASTNTTQHMADGGAVALIKRAVLFVGLYRATRVWAKMAVKRVADDTIFGAEAREDFSDKAVASVAFTTIWMLMLRCDVEHMVFATFGRSDGLIKEMEFGGCARWFVSHAIMMTGIVRSVRALAFAGKLLCCSFIGGDEEHFFNHAAVDHKADTIHQFPLLHSLASVNSFAPISQMVKSEKVVAVE
ncbi:hypothetical protein Cni_G15424 [Canna indica]|uniref:Uncharacterized protein n=1 Tax=Canna indica TaxID=4628 RepID=A0AAQ3QFQ5_9LILI|nr:hypothetical protein Cni_G15424 [Canna indica]